MRYLYFVRHGQTDWNLEDKICGITDRPLTELGYAQAEETGKAILDQGIRFDKILCSPLIRARETARIISEMTGVEAAVEPRLIEQNFGKYEGMPRKTPEYLAAKLQFAERNETGESMLQIAHRVYSLLDEIRDDPEQKTYLLVAHMGVGRSIRSYFTSMNNEEYAYYGVPNCAVVRFAFPEA